MLIPIVIEALEPILKRLIKRQKKNGRIENKMSGVHPDYGIIKIGENTEENPED